MSLQNSGEPFAKLSGLSERLRSQRAAALTALSRLPLGAKAEHFRPILGSVRGLTDEALEAGVKALVADFNRDRNPDIRPRVNRSVIVPRVMVNAARTIVQHASVGAAVVEYFDTMMVGGKRLGDATRADLEVESNKLHSQSKATARQAYLLAHIANELVGNETVRASKKRTVIIEILRQSLRG